MTPATLVRMSDFTPGAGGGLERTGLNVEEVTMLSACYNRCRRARGESGR